MPVYEVSGDKMSRFIHQMIKVFYQRLEDRPLGNDICVRCIYKLGGSTSTQISVVCISLFQAMQISRFVLITVDFAHILNGYCNDDGDK